MAPALAFVLHASHFARDCFAVASQRLRGVVPRRKHRGVCPSKVCGVLFSLKDSGGWFLAKTAVRLHQRSLEDMQGGTFTITNGGTFGSMLSTSIINAPQSAILGMHNIMDRPVAVDGEVKIRPVMYLALSYDHRIIDGKDSVSFLRTIKELLEDPA